MQVVSKPLNSDAECDRWDRLVQGLDSSTWCHLSGWKKVIETAYGHRCYFLETRNGGTRRGIMPLAYMRGRFTINRLVSLPYLDLGGPAAENEKSAAELIAGGLDLCRSLGAEGMDLRGPQLTSDEDTPGVGPHRVRFLLDLPPSPEELWAMFDPKVRNQIRKSEKLDLTTRRVPPSELNEFYRVFTRNMRDLGSPTHSFVFFRRIAQVIPSQFGLYLTTDKDERTVAAGIALHFRNVVTVPWASSVWSARPMCPNHSLYWKILSDAIEARASEFDFGRSRTDSGTYRFKKQWGARPTPLLWSFLDSSGKHRSDDYLDPKRQKLLVDLWRRLPLPVSRWLGPVVRRQLPN